MSAFFGLLVTKLREPSTWVGLTMLASTIGYELRPELAQQIGETAASIFGLIYIIKKG